jgi:hypothetical protein
MTNPEKMLKFVPVLPAKIRLSVLREKTGMTVQEILTLARKFGFTVNTVLNDPTIAQKRETSEILIYKNEFPYKAVKGLTEASKLTKIPKTTILSMILAKLTKKKEKKNGGLTTPDGWGFDYLA